jgi:adenylate cyclase
MSLAGDGRILLTRAAYDLARRAVAGTDEGTELRWTQHGHYRLAGVEEPMEVCEVGSIGTAPPIRPPGSEKAQPVDEPSIASAPPRAPPTAARVEPLLAVLAFDNLSNDPEMQFFSDGVSEDLIARLSRGAGLKVIGRTSSFQFRGERKAAAAQHLGCSHILDGSIRRAAARVRVSAHLLETASHTTLWSERYDRGLDDIFAIQDDISERIATALDQAFARAPTAKIDPGVYDLYLRACPRSYAPDELRASVDLLERATARAPNFKDAWARLAYVRAFLHFYQPFAERPGAAARIAVESGRALALDGQCVDALIAQLFVIPPFGAFLDAAPILQRVRQTETAPDARRYVGWFLRTTGHLDDSLQESERAYALDQLNPMTANGAALARMAAGHIDDAIPLYETLVEQVPEMSFPVASLLRCYAFQQNWSAVDRLLTLAERRQLREFNEGLPFIRTKRNPTPANIERWRAALDAHVALTGSVDVSRLVYAAHLGLVDAAYRATESARLGPVGRSDDIMGPDGYRTSLMFQADMPELRNDPRFPRLCARLGLVEFWTQTGRWPDCVATVPYDFRAECAKVSDVPKDVFWP